MSVGRGPSALWAFLFRAGLARGHMPFWRVVVEARLDRRAQNWPADADGAVTAVFVWARTIEEAEGLAALALAEDGLDAVTCDAVKQPPAAMPKRVPMAMSRTELGFITHAATRAPSDRSSRWDARA